MVKVSTLFHRVDGFNQKEVSYTWELPDQQIETQFLKILLDPLEVDPGEELVQRILSKI